MVKTYPLCLLVIFLFGCEDSQRSYEPEMVFVEGGEFMLGCTEEQIPNCISDEKPGVNVQLDDYWIGRYEITTIQFAKFLSERGNQEKGSEDWYKPDEYSLIDTSEIGKFKPRHGFENHPISNVSWYGAQAYTQWLSQKTRKNYRLPTEAEWEYAARGGQKSQGFIFSGSDILEEVAWYSDYAKNSGTGWKFKEDRGTHPVGQKIPNELGLYDMSGNVSELCFDFYDNHYEGGSNPKGPPYGSLKTQRGGSWDNNETDCRISARNYDQHVSRFPVSDGFRVVMDNR